MTISRPCLADVSKTQFEQITGHEFTGPRCMFGQLVYFRDKRPEHPTLAPNLSPALFLGWRLDSGFRYREVVKVIPYDSFKAGQTAAIDVPQGELFHDDLSNPSFPAAAARDKDEALPTIPGKDVALPF